LGAVVLTCGGSATGEAGGAAGYLECDGVGMRVLEAQRLRHLMLERACQPSVRGRVLHGG